MSRVPRRQDNYAMAVMPAPQEEMPEEGEVAPAADRGRRRFGFFRRRKADEPTEESHEPTATAVLSEATKVNDETLASLQRTEKVMYEAESIGNETAVKIAEGKETIHQVDSTVEGFEPMTKRAQRDALKLMRGLARDKCFLCLAFAVVLAVVAVIIAVTVWPEDVSDIISSTNVTLTSI